MVLPWLKVFLFGGYYNGIKIVLEESVQ